MAWKVNADGSRGGENSAFDGDADIIYGLILADRQWGSQGDINYRQEAIAKLEGKFAHVNHETAFISHVRCSYSHGGIDGRPR